MEDSVAKLLAILVCVIVLLAGAYMAVDSYLANRTNSLASQVTTLLAENAELRRRVIEQNNERLLYEAAKKDNDTVNLVARWHVFQPILLLLGGICFVVVLPLIWMGWTYALQYYLSAIKRLDERS